MDSTTTDRRRWWTLAVLCLSLLVVSLDNTILNVALPTLVEDLSATASQQQWMVDAYTLIFASLLLATGSLGDKFGRRGALATGMVIFGAGDAVDPDQRVHRPQGAHQGDRGVGRRVRSRRGHRPGARRLAARALLVGL